MTQTEETKRAVPGAEMFFGESVAQYLAELSDEAYQAELGIEGLLLGKAYSDNAGQYVVVSGITQDYSKTAESVGWFGSSDSTVFSPEHLRIMDGIFKSRAYAIIVDASRGAMATYSVEHGVARKIPSVMVENY